MKEEISDVLFLNPKVPNLWNYLCITFITAYFHHWICMLTCHVGSQIGRNIICDPPCQKCFCRQKSKFVLFSHEILCCKTFQMTYYLFIYDVPNRSCVTLKYSSFGNYFWRKRNKSLASRAYASLATHTYSKTTRM